MFETSDDCIEQVEQPLRLTDDLVFLYRKGLAKTKIILYVFLCEFEGCFLKNVHHILKVK